jgi:radical SAM protein with 4Fe4S-binding SPASM domain
MSSFGFQWHLTDRCNQRCTHCYQEDFTPGSELPLASLELAAERILSGVSGETVSVNVTGGEPLLLPGFFDLMSRLQSYANLEEINIITNGTVTPDRVLDGIRSMPRAGVIKVSLESASERTNDIVRGEGNHRKVLQGIERLLARTGKSVVLMVTLARYNIGEIGGMVELARKTGVSGVIFERFIPLGNGLALMNQALDRGSWSRAVAAISAAAGGDETPEDLVQYRAFWLWTDGRSGGVLDGALCNLGRGSMAVMPDGTVYPCRRLPLPVGNVLRDPFGEIRLRLGRFGVDGIRDRLQGDFCGWCGVEECAGCRAMARAMTGSHLLDDPQCILTGGG